MAKKMGTDGLVLARPRKHASLHFGHGYVYGGSSSPPPPPPPPTGLHDWGAFTSMTETRRNASGSTVSGAPVRWVAQFHAGEVTTSTWFDLYREGVLVSSTEWQLGEISTYPDGSMRSATVRCYGKSSWTNGSTSQFNLVAKSGSWPSDATNPAGNSVATSKVTAASALKLSLTDITLLGSPYGSTTQPAYSAPNLDSELNRALGSAPRTRKYAAGNVCVAWRTWEKMQPPGGGSSDPQLWVLWFVEAWLDPSSGNLLHLSVEPYVNNGWARVQGMLKAFKMALYDGGATLRDFATVASGLSASDWELSNGVYHFTGVNRAATFPYSTFDGRVGSALKVGGSPSSGVTAGKIYQIGAPYPDGPLWERWQQPRMALATLGYFAGGSGMTFVNPGSGGTTYTLTHYNYASDKQSLPVRDGNGIEFWPIGGASGKIWPSWTRAERIRRMQTALVPNAVIETVTDRTGQSFSGYNFNSGGKNTGLLPNFSGQNKYTPGATIHHSSFFEDGGYWFSGLLHKSECSWWMFNFLNDPSQDAFVLTQLQAAAESAGFLVGLNCYENSTSGGVEIAYPICVNNGPDKAGTQYSGMGPCRPTAQLRQYPPVGIDNPGQEVAGGGSTTYDESQAAHWSTTTGTGAHGSKEICYAYALHGSPGYRELMTGLWMRASLQDFSGTPTDTYGSNKKLGGVDYYRVSILATTADTQTRAFVARSSWLGYALNAPDTEPYKAMLQDIASDNVNLMEAAYDDPNVIGSTAKVLGAPTGSRTGGEQSWHLSRVNWAALMLAKRSGVSCPKTVAYHSAFGRFYFNDPVGGGSGPGFHSTGWMGAQETHVVQYFDKAAYASPSSAAGTQAWMRDAASSVTDGSRMAITLPYADANNSSVQNYVRFLTDGQTVQYTMPFQDLQDTANFIPNNRDEIAASYNLTEAAESGTFTLLPGLTWYYLYDKTEATHVVKLPLTSGSLFALGQTITDSAGNTATVLHGGGYTRDQYTITKPSPSNFVSGTITFTGGTCSYNGTIVGKGYNYKLSSTDPDVSVTQKTWTTATVVEVTGYSMTIIYKTRRTGNQTGGLMKLRNNSGDPIVNQGWLGHIFAPAQLAATLFGATETGLDTTIDRMEQFYADVLSGQSFYFYDIADSSGAWSFHYAYPPGAT